mmetsp:Transcript_49038/g.138795  ORF Transcript_49038/g.138795 Transcript_49038/m.138795 type:complete len:84 (+) Transcript_49038:2069-2320(+)
MIHGCMTKEASASQIVPRTFEAVKEVLMPCRRSHNSISTARSALSHEDFGLYEDLILLERGQGPVEEHEEEGLDAAESSDDGM